MRGFDFEIRQATGGNKGGAQARHARWRAPRRPVAAVTVGALLAAAVTGSVAVPAAATSSLSPATSFAIDGNLTGSNDWGSLYGPGTTPGGYPTTGVYGSTLNDDICALATDDAAGNGEKLSDGPAWDELVKKITPEKSDLDALYLAAEKVDVNGTINDILYAAYQRCTSDNGSMIAAMFLDSGDGVLPSQGGTGDYLLLFDFNPSQGSTARLYTWTGGGWGNPSTPSSQAVEVKATQTIGEVAINLTKLNVLPKDKCRTVNMGGQVATASGFDPNSSLIDVLDVRPFTITTCGNLDVKKTANVPDDGSLFGYDVGQEDQNASFSSSLDTSGVQRNTTASNQFKTLSADIKVGETDAWRRVIASTDYFATEDMGGLADGWELESIICTYQDIFVAGYPTKTVTLYPDSQTRTFTTGGGGGNKTFHVPPSFVGGTSVSAAQCTLNNQFTGIKVVKEGTGDPNQTFNFTIGEKAFTLKLGESKTFPATPGELTKVQEGTLPVTALDWDLDKIICKDSDGVDVGTIWMDYQKAKVTPKSGDLITCTFTNNQEGRLIVKKASSGGVGVFPITGTAAGTITTTSANGEVSGNTLIKKVDAGTGYSVGETVPSGWRLDGISCDSGETNPANITIGGGETVTCTVTNTKLGKLNVTKTVSGVAPTYPWSFGFTLSPAATGGGLQTATGTGNSSAVPLTWTALQPGTTYTLTESGTDGYQASVLCKDAKGATIPDANLQTGAYDVAVVPGMVLDCVATNAAKPGKLELTKTVTGVADGYAWDFDFTLSPAATGGGKQTASGGGDGQDVLNWTNLIPGTTYTITEEVDSNYTQSLSCAGVRDLDKEPHAVTFVAGLDQSIVCAAGNAADPSSITVTKTVAGVDESLEWAFDFTLAPAATGGGKQTASGAGDGVSEALVWTELVPGRQYVITESSTWEYDQAFSCTGVSDLDKESTSVTFIAGFDQAIVCSATNTAKPADISLTKEVTGVAEDYEWEFGFALTPGEDGPEVQYASGAGPDEDVLTWDDLIPGKEYSIAEETDGDYSQTLKCNVKEDLNDDPAVVTFIAGFDQHIECAADNAAKPTDISLTKLVEGVANSYEWSFGFTLSKLGGGVGVTRYAEGSGVSTDVLDWTGLVPGQTYVLQEEVDGDYTQTLWCVFATDEQEPGIAAVVAPAAVPDLDESPTSVTFVAGFDQDIECFARNIAKPALMTLAKDVEGVASTYAWAFDFELTSDSGTRSVEKMRIGGTGEVAATPRSFVALVPGTTYMLAEDVPEGYLSELACTINGSTRTAPLDLDFNPSTVTFVAGFGEAIVCTAENDVEPTSVSVTKEVTGVADDYQWQFDFALAPEATGGGTQTASGTGDASDTLTWDDLVPGVEYTMTEETVEGFTQTLECTGIEDSNPAANAVTWVHEVALDLTCDATNTALPSTLSLTKNVTGVAEGYQWEFGFTLAVAPDEQEPVELAAFALPDGSTQTASGTGPDNDSIEWESLIPGERYVLTEDLNEGYDQTLTCEGVDDLDEDQTTVTFVAGFDQDITCEAVNDAIPSRLTLTKTVTGVAEDYPWAFGFTLEVAPFVDDELIEPAALIVEDSGSKTATGTGPDSDTLEWEGLIPGERYILTEDAVEGYDQTLECVGVEDWDDDASTVTFVAGFDQAITCAAGNAAQPSQLTLTKSVTGVADGFEWAFDFTLIPGVEDGGIQTVSGDGSTTSEPIVWADLIPGTTYTVLEEMNDAYDSTLVCEGVEDSDPSDAAVTFVAGFGQSIVCEAVNVAHPATVSLEKEVTGVAATYAWVFDFVLTPGVPRVGDPRATGVGGEHAMVEWTGLIPGQEYTVAEPDGASYIESLSCTGTGEDRDTAPASVTFIAGLDQDIECTAVNRALPDTLSITKTVTGIGDNEPWAFSFALTPEAGELATQLVEGTGPGTADPAVWSNLIPGTTYTVAEQELDSHVQNLECTGVADLDEVAYSVTFVAGFGEAIECTATNDAIASTLDLTKTVEGLPAGVEWEFEFTLTPDQGEATAHSIGGTGNGTSEAVTWDLIPGVTYTITEPKDKFYDQDLSCMDIDDLDDAANSVTFVAPYGDVVTCMATNVLEPVVDVDTDEGEIPNLSTTGAEVQNTLTVAVLLLGAGVVLMAVRRRRQS